MNINDLYICILEYCNNVHKLREINKNFDNIILKNIFNNRNVEVSGKLLQHLLENKLIFSDIAPYDNVNLNLGDILVLCNREINDYENINLLKYFNKINSLSVKQYNYDINNFAQSENLNMGSHYSAIFNVIIKNSKELQKLSLYDCGINSDIYENMVELKYLKVYNINMIEKNFEKLQNLQTLDISFSNNLTGDIFKYTKKLKKLIIDECDNLMDEGLKNLINLEELSISMNYNNLSEKIFENLNKLKILRIKSCPNLSSNMIKYLVNLKTLEIKECNEIADNSIKNLKYLRNLHIFGCDGITDKAFLDDTKSFYKLSVSYNNNITSNIFDNIKVKNLILKKCNNIEEDILLKIHNVNKLCIKSCEKMEDVEFDKLKNKCDYDTFIHNKINDPYKFYKKIWKYFIKYLYSHKKFLLMGFFSAFFYE